MNLQGGESRPVVGTEEVMLQVIFRNMLVKKKLVCVCTEKCVESYGAGIGGVCELPDVLLRTKPKDSGAPNC